MDETRRRERLPKDSEIREVHQLFPQTEIDLSSTERANYDSLGEFAFALDRQSIPKKAREDTATGMIRRVEAILLEAKRLKLYLPEPSLRKDRSPNELPYGFGGPCHLHWFVDGTSKKATGFAANQNARPELWRAFLTAKTLHAAGCPPKAILIGEGTRLFRDDGWLTAFAQALWRRDIKIYVHGFDEVNSDTLPGFVAYINALSGWLGTVNKGARKIRREEGRIFGGQPHYLVQFSKDKRHVYAHPERWPVIRKMLEQLAEGHLASTQAASDWLCDQGHYLSQTWVCELLAKEILDGFYVLGDKEYKQRWIEQKDGLFRDLDVTEGGTRRYLVLLRPPDAEEIQRFPIEHPYGTEPLPASLVRAVRVRVQGQWRRRKHDLPSDTLIPSRLVRCAVCGHAVAEQCPAGRNSPSPKWRLACRAHSALQYRLKRGLPTDTFPPHKRCRPGRLSEIVWERLVEGLGAIPLDKEEPDRDLLAEKMRLEADLVRAEQVFARFQERCLSGEVGDQKNPQVKAWVENKRKDLIAAIWDLQRQLEHFVDDRLAEQRLNASVREVQEALRWTAEEQLTLRVKREIIEQLVRKVIVHLEPSITLRATHATRNSGLVSAAATR